MHPTKHQISLLYAHNFKLWDGSRQWQIESLHKEGISIVMDETDTLPNSITFEDIGRGFKVIRRPLSDLTVADGDGKLAIVELAKVALQKDFNHRPVNFKSTDDCWEIQIENTDGTKLQFAYLDQSFVIYNRGLSIGCPNQQQLFEKLYELGFFPSLADDCCVDFNAIKIL